MVNMRIENKQSFKIAGRKIWISGQDNEIFGAFWKESHENGLIEQLKSVSAKIESKVTNSDVLGVSCVENDPAIRAFNFYIATEIIDEINTDKLERFIIPECTWAIFSNRGNLPMALIEAEMYAFMEWLPASQYNHAHAPELEVYPVNDNSSVEFWIPIIAK